MMPFFSYFKVFELSVLCMLSCFWPMLGEANAATANWPQFRGPSYLGLAEGLADGLSEGLALGLTLGDTDGDAEGAALPALK